MLSGQDMGKLEKNGREDREFGGVWMMGTKMEYKHSMGKAIESIRAQTHYTCHCV